MSDWDLVCGNSRPQIPPHRTRDAGVETTDPVDPAGGANREHGHTEQLIGPSRLHASEVKECLVGQAERLAKRREVALDLVRQEYIDAGRDRRVRREDPAGSHNLERVAKRHLLLVNEPPNPLEPQKRACTLVHVEDEGAEADREQRADAAHAEDDLLANPHLAVAAVQLAGDVLQIGRVLGDVGVE